MEITAEQYARIKDGLPVQRGNISLTNLQVPNAILHIAEQGCKWRGLPKRFGRWHTIYMRMNRWATKGVLDRVFDQPASRTDRAHQDRSVLDRFHLGEGSPRRKGGSKTNGPQTT